MVTIKDVAERAGVAVATVSRVLNDRGSISDRMRRRVYEAMRELNYVPNEAARSLQRQQSNLVALTLPELEGSYYAQVAHAVTRELARVGFSVTFYLTAKTAAGEARALEEIQTARPAGVLVCDATGADSPLAACTLPMVAIDTDLGPEVPFVSSDNAQGGRLAAETLLQGGCRCPVVIQDPLYQLSESDLGRAFLARCAQAGVTAQVAPVTKAQPDRPQEDRETYRRVLEQCPQADALLTHNDEEAVRACLALRALDRRVPEDVQVVGIGGLPVGDYVGLTTLIQPVGQIAEFAADMLTRRIRGQLIPARSLLPVTLSRRDTTRGAGN